MASIAWTRKYRATNMNEYIGEEIKEKTINRFKDEKDFPQTILVSGTRGTGKTSVCRLIAKTIHCENRQNGCACGVCDSCKAIDEELIGAEFGVNTLGVTEINVGTDGGKADVEKMVDDMMQQPQYPFKYNVFILDECHMFTNQAQNALLKILEEPPSYLIVMLATTDPDRLLGTVRDRCQFKLKVKPPSVNEIVDRLMYISQQEKLTVSEKALALIARQCKKNPRDSIMTLENVAKNYDHRVDIENVMKEIGAISTAIYVDYIERANSNEPIASTLEFLSVLEEKGIEYREFLSGLSNFVISCLQIKYGVDIEDMSPEMGTAAQKLFKSYTIEDTDCLLQILEYANKQVRNDENLGRMTILTTAMRIAKVKLLAIGLQSVQADSESETKKGSILAAEVHKQELESAQAQADILDESTLTAALGREVKEVASGINLSVTDDEDEHDNMTDYDDEKLLSMFGQN